MALPPRSTLVAHWKMNDNAASTAVIDNIGGFNGVWQHGNTSTDSVAGKINNALSFDGTNDYAIVSDNAVFNTSTFTVCAWLKHSTTPGAWDRIFTKKTNFSDSDGYDISCDGGTTNILYTSGSSGTFATTDIGVSFNTGNWIHLVVIYNGTSITVYRDGSLKTTTGTIASVVSNAVTPKIGKITAETTTMWDGLMDDIRYYNVALTQDQVTSIYNSGNGTETDYYIPHPLPGRE